MKVRYEEKIKELMAELEQVLSKADVAANQNGDVSTQLKKVMNSVFQQIRVDVDKEKSYLGKQFLELTMKIIQRETLRAAGELSESEEEDDADDEEEEASDSEGPHSPPPTPGESNQPSELVKNAMQKLNQHQISTRLKELSGDPTGDNQFLLQPPSDSPQIRSSSYVSSRGPASPPPTPIEQSNQDEETPAVPPPPTKRLSESGDHSFQSREPPVLCSDSDGSDDDDSEEQRSRSVSEAFVTESEEPSSQPEKKSPKNPIVEAEDQSLDKAKDENPPAVTEATPSISVAADVEESVPAIEEKVDTPELHENVDVPDRAEEIRQDVDPEDIAQHDKASSDGFFDAEDQNLSDDEKEKASKSHVSDDTKEPKKQSIFSDDSDAEEEFGQSLFAKPDEQEKKPPPKDTVKPLFSDDDDDDDLNWLNS